ncbi:MAG: hypothetical protein U0556_10405 [Dehalococcoidia bacterium]
MLTSEDLTGGKTAMAWCSAIKTPRWQSRGSFLAQRRVIAPVASFGSSKPLLERGRLSEHRELHHLLASTGDVERTRLEVALSIERGDADVAEVILKPTPAEPRRGAVTGAARTFAFAVAP